MNNGHALKIATFTIDVTPPLGHPLAYGINKKVDSPIYIRGIIADDENKRIVFVSADFIGIWGKTYEEMKRLIAGAARTSPQYVSLHVVHQHDSVRISPELNGIFKKYKGLECTPLSYYNDVKIKLEINIQKAVKNFKRVKKTATAEKRLSGLASNRRLLDANGKVYDMRWSMCTDPKLQKESVGEIDPILRTIAFIGVDNNIIAAMHFYASHPMTAYNRNMVGTDVPGVALNYVEKHCGYNFKNIHFTGCGGNITFGKYSISPPEKSLKLLGERLGKAMFENCASLEDKPIGPIEFKRCRFEIPLAPDITEKNMLEKIKTSENKELALEYSIRIALKKNWNKLKTSYISRFSIGNEISVLSFPSETVVEYQLYAQSLVPEKFLACAAYANTTYDYIPTKAMYEEGGYEPEYGAISTADVENNIKMAIYTALKNLI